MISKAIFFDAGNILFSSDLVKQQDYLILEKHGVNISSFKSRFRKLRQRAQYDRDYSLTDARKDSLMNLVDENKLEIILSDLNQSDTQKKYGLKQGVKSALKNLSEESFLGIITNTHLNESEIREILHSQEIGDYFSLIVSSKDVGILKPDHRIYILSSEKAGLKPKNCYFVGHDYNELKAAYDLGMKPIAFNYRGKESAVFIPEKRIVIRFKDITKAIE